MHWHASPSCRGLGPRVILLCLAAVLGLAPVAASAQSPRPKARVSAVGPHGDVFVLTNGTVTVPFGTPDIALTATVSDATPPITYAWMGVDSPAGSTFTLTGANTPTATVGSFSVVGRYVFTVDVTDGSGGSDSASVTVFVLPNAYVTAPGTTSRRVAQGSATNVPLGTTYAAAAGRRYKWREATGGDIAGYTPFGDVTITPDGTVDGAGFSNAPTATAAVPAARPAGRVYRFVVEVVDNGSAATSSDVSIVINTPPTAPGKPTISPSLISVQNGGLAMITSTASTDGDGDTLQYTFRLVSGPAPRVALPPASATPSGTLTFTAGADAPGGTTYTFACDVSDGLDTVSSLTSDPVTVAAAPMPGAVTVTPPAPGQPVGPTTTIAKQSPTAITVDITGSTGPAPLTYSWQLVSGPAGTVTFNSAPFNNGDRTPLAAQTSATFTINPVGMIAGQSYVFRATVQSSVGDRTESANVTVTINIPPAFASAATATMKDRNGPAMTVGPVCIAFQNNCVAAVNSTLLSVGAAPTATTYAWAVDAASVGLVTINDASSATPGAEAVNFQTAGRDYAFTVTATDAFGDTVTSSVSVRTNVPPTISSLALNNPATATPTFAGAPGPATFNIIRSTDAGSLNAVAQTNGCAGGPLMYMFGGVAFVSDDPTSSQRVVPVNVAPGAYTVTLRVTDSFGDCSAVSSLPIIKNQRPVVAMARKVGPSYNSLRDNTPLDGLSADFPNPIKSTDRNSTLGVNGADDDLIYPLAYTWTKDSAGGVGISFGSETFGGSGSAYAQRRAEQIIANGFPGDGVNYRFRVVATDGVETSDPLLVTIHSNRLPSITQLNVMQNVFRASNSGPSDQTPVLLSAQDTAAQSLVGGPQRLRLVPVFTHAQPPADPNNATGNAGGRPSFPTLADPSFLAARLFSDNQGQVATFSASVRYDKSGTYTESYVVDDGLEVVAQTVNGILVDVPPKVTDTTGTLALIVGEPGTYVGGPTDDDAFVGPFTFAWSKQSGPGNITFSANAGTFAPPSLFSPLTTATFSAAGEYTLKLTVNDAQYSSDLNALNSTLVAPTTNPAFFPRLAPAAPLSEIRRIRAYKPPVGPGSLLPATSTFRLPIINLSTRVRVGTGDQRAIAGFVVSPGEADSNLPAEQRRRSRFVIRVLGPSLAGQNGLTAADVLQDPKLTIILPPLVNGNGTTTPVTPIVNDDYRVNNPTLSVLAAQTGLAPTNDKEAAYVLEFTHDGQSNSAFTVIAEGVNNGTGIALVEIYDATSTLPSGIAQSTAKLINVSTRGLIGSPGAADQMIAGFVIGSGSNSDQTVIVRALGPSLALSAPNLAATTRDPDLRVSLGSTTVVNSSWLRREASNGALELGAAADARFESARFNVIQNTALQFFRRTAGRLISPDANNQINEINDLEAMTALRLGPGAYTALAADAAPGSAAVGLIEVYAIPTTQDAR